MRIHFATIRTEIESGPEVSLERRLELAGKNTGNLMFTNAVWRQVRFASATRTLVFDPDKVNAECDVVVMPAANWLNEYEDFGWLADLVERLTVPVVLIGIGAQAQDGDELPRVTPGTMRLVRAIASRSHAIGVRGDLSRAVLEDHGITNVVAIGCPSLYGWRGTHESIPKRRGAKRLVLGGTRYWPPRVQPAQRPHGLKRLVSFGKHRLASRLPLARHDRLQGNLYASALRMDAHLCLQSERPEIDLVESVVPDTIALPPSLVRLYEAHTEPGLRDYLARRASVYFDVDAWIAAMGDFDAYIGSRLHGTIASMLGGTPAMLVTHDRRTQEVADLATIPQMRIEEFADVGVEGALARLTQESLERYSTTRRRLRERYEAFLRSNGLVPVDDFDPTANDSSRPVEAAVP